jgi:hypothetical protein
MRPVDILFGDMRERAKASNSCVPAPIGCGGPAKQFGSPASEREYGISGLCQNCQDSIFRSDEDDMD